MDRRKFLKTTAAGGAILSIGVAPQGCGNPVTPAPLAKVVTHTADMSPEISEAVLFDAAASDGDNYGTIQLLVGFYLQLIPVGGAITLQLPSDITATNTRGYSIPPNNTILVIHQNGGGDDDNSFLALQSSCPHAACPLGYNATAKPPLIECPCHASRFYSDPTVKTRGQTAGSLEHRPANQALQRWKAVASTIASGTLLTIDLKIVINDCATLPAAVLSGDRKSFTLTLATAQFPELATPGGSVCGQPLMLGNPIAVVRIDASTIIALDAKCTHLGCTVAWDPQNQDFACPCHGSTFATTGRVQIGPATTDLKSYNVSVDADNIVITGLT